MKKIIFDNSLVRIYDEGYKDRWGVKVYKRYPIVDGNEVDLLEDKDVYTVGIFVYKSTNKDKQSTAKRLGKNVGTEMFIDCPTDYVIL